MKKQRKDSIVRIPCDVCGKKFGCKDSDIDKKFGWGSYCSDECRRKLSAAITNNE